VTPWNKTVGAITLFVDDLARARAFYHEVFGVPVAFEDEESAVFRFDNLLVNLLAAGSAPALIAPARVGGAEAGARSQLTIWVDDVDAVSAEVVARGVTLLNGPMDRAWGQRTACFSDPDGHIWELAQELPTP
jgi:catechol 2,3-dioxygenase-like lactoylglutathione lyase family enzyme